MKKLLNFIKSPKFFGMSCLAAAGFLMGLLITDDIPFWFQVLYIIVFWSLTGIGYYILNRLSFNEELKHSKKYRGGLISNKNDREITTNFNDESSVHTQKYIDERTIEVRAKDGSYQSIIKE